MLAKAALKARELETPVLGLNAPVFSLNPRGAISKAMTGALPLLGIRRQYYDLEALLDDACPQFAGIDWPNLENPSGRRYGCHQRHRDHVRLCPQQYAGGGYEVLARAVPAVAERGRSLWKRPSFAKPNGSLAAAIGTASTR